ncbi:MAG: rhomboid family intramembrane serine protease [Planctomycetota bacterium]
MDVVRAIPGTPVTVSICVLAIALSIKGWSVGFEPFIVDRRAFWAEPWRLLSAHFVHADTFHLIFNLSWIWFLGREIEARLGSLALCGMSLLLMLGVSEAEQAFDRGAIGLSGVVYGLWTLIFVGQRRCETLRGILTTRTNRLMVVWFFVCILLTLAEVIPISNWGHGAGAAIGALLGIGLRADGGLRWPLLPAGLLSFGLLAGGATVWWPAWNFGGGAQECGHEGIVALEQSDWTTAELAFRKALRCDSKDGWAWWNLGFALNQQGRRDDSIEACYQAFLSGPLDSEQTASLSGSLLWLTHQRRGADDDHGAFESSRRAVEVAPNDEEAWRVLGELAGNLGDKAWSARAKSELARLGGNK